MQDVGVAVECKINDWRLQNMIVPTKFHLYDCSILTDLLICWFSKNCTAFETYMLCTICCIHSICGRGETFRIALYTPYGQK